MAQTKIKAGLFEGIIGNGTDGYFLMSNGDGTMTWSQPITPPTISSIDYPSSATAADPAGGETIVINGADFKTGATVTIGGTSAPTVSFVSATQINFTTPAKAAGDYDIVVINTDGGTATSVNGISYNGVPAWTTATGSLGSFASDTTISTITLQAAEPDAGTITFSITNGALPTGLSLTGANIDGTTSIVSADTTYNFTVTATDDENQATGRAFSITIEKYIVVPSEHFTINTYTGNSSTQTIEGKIGTVAEFNGSNSQIVLPSLGNTYQNNFSVSFWFNIQTIPSGGISTFISGQGDYYFYCFLRDSDKKLETRVEVGATGHTIKSNTTFTNNSGWHHACITKSSTDGLKIYVNGTLENSDGAATGNLNTSASNNTLGIYGNLSSYWLDGKMDQVRIFSKALSSSEVTTLYGEPSNLSTKSTTDVFADGSGVALYDFEDTARVKGSKPHYLFIGDAGGQSTSVRINSVDAEFTYTRPAGYEEWGGSFDPNNTAYDYQGSANNVTFSENNKKWDKVGSYYHAAWATNGYSSGKYYVELEFLAADLIFGLSTSATADTVHSGASFYDNAITYFSYSANKREYSSTLTAGGAVLSANDVIGLAVDFDNQSLSYYVNNTLQDTITLQSYNGTPSNVNFVGTSFQPDLVWIKRRDNGVGNTNHFLFDSVRGAGERLMPNLTTANTTITDELTSFNSNGFSLGADVSANGSGGDHVAWCWKAASSNSTNTNGSITSTVRANQDAGFSIVSYDGATNATTDTSNNGGSYWNVGHGLSQAPELIIAKKTNNVGGWYAGFNISGVGSFDIGSHMVLNSTAAQVNTTSDLLWGNQNPSSTTFGVGGWDVINRNGDSYIAYCFHSVDSYQKIGSYTGTGASGNTITTGFKPRFLMIKNSTGVYEWVIVDSIRGGDRELNPNSSVAENATGDPANISFTSTGFVINNTEGATNQNNATIIYLAIA